MRRSSQPFSHLQDDSAKVAVYTTEMPASELQQQERLQIVIGVTLMVLSGLVAWMRS
jgi:hypothetical protein